MVRNLEANPLDEADQGRAIKTWRYLRVAMVLLVVGLAVAVGFEVWKTGTHCFKTSISAYYYTPVRGYFVSALVGVGVCLYCLKGSENGEDAFLNIAGMCAPIVALVPTETAGPCAPSIATTIVENVKAADVAHRLTAEEVAEIGRSCCSRGLVIG